MAQLAQQWSESGETQAQFAARHGVSATKLRYWLRRRAPAARDSVGFARVQVFAADPDGQVPIEIVLSTGERVVVTPGVSLAFLRQVLTALR
jgi:hypothetical protein